MLNHLSLFSGYEGFGLGLKLARIDFKTVGYVEIDEYCQQLLQTRIRDGFLDWAPIIRDIRTADFRPMAGLVDIITAGFPCQPHSVAGQQRGADDERNLWPDTLRAISEVGPRWVLLENVPGILANQYAGTVVGQLSEIGYDCEWGIVSAAEVGANHRRKRWWCLAANTASSGRERSPNPVWTSGLRESETAILADHDGKRRRTSRKNNGLREADPLIRSGTYVAHTQRGREQRFVRRGEATWRPGSEGWWATEPDVGRVANGVADRVAQLRALGNGIVPGVVAEFLRRLAP